MELSAKIKSMRLKSIDKRLSLDGQLTLGEAFQLFQTVPIEIAIYDLNGNYKYVNKYYAADDEINNAIIGKDDACYFDLMGISPDAIEKRKEYFQEVDCIWNEEMPIPTLVAASYMAARSERLQGVDWQTWAGMGKYTLMYKPGDWWIWEGD